MTHDREMCTGMPIRKYFLVSFDPWGVYTLSKTRNSIEQFLSALSVYIKVEHLPSSKRIAFGDCCKMTFHSCDFKIISQILVLAGIFTPIDVFFAEPIYREISEDISWIEEDLLEYLQLTFEFQFKVSFPLGSCCPILDISSYDRVKHTEDKCFNESVGAETKWFRGLYKLKPLDRDEKTDILCKEDADKYECILNYKALYFEPKKIRYIIGYECSDLPK